MLVASQNEKQDECIQLDMAQASAQTQTATRSRIGWLLQLLNGFLIGVANIIPGVSGGTFALVLGIYDRLVTSLKSINLHTIRIGIGLVTGGFSADARRRFADEWKRVDATFLCLIAFGAATAIGSCAWLLDYLLANHPGETLAFFVGLIIPSLVVPLRMMDKRGLAQFVWIVPGIALTVWLSLSSVATDGDQASYAVVFVGGVLAVSAMILPGVSGSFLLLVLGLYQPVIQYIKEMMHSPSRDAVLFLGVLAAGVLVGFVTFTRVMSFMLRRFRSATLAFLIGLILGSFWVLWPVKEFQTSQQVDVKRNIQVATAANRLPFTQDGDAALVARLLLAAFVGFIAAMGVNRLGETNREMDAVKEPDANPQAGDSTRAP